MALTKQQLRTTIFRSGDVIGGARKFTWSGEKRPPKKGEYYLSGAIPVCYLAKHDLSSSYHIMVPYNENQ